MARQIVVSLFGSTGSVWLFDPIAETFTESVIGTSSTWHHLAYAPRSKTIVAAGAGGLIASSEDAGATWDVDDLGAGNVESVIWDGEQFVALADDEVWTAEARPSVAGWTDVGDNAGAGVNTPLGARDLIKRSSSYYSESLRRGILPGGATFHTGAVMIAPVPTSPAGTWTASGQPYLGGGLEVDVPFYQSTSAASRSVVDRTLDTDGSLIVGVSPGGGTPGGNNRVVHTIGISAPWIQGTFPGFVGPAMSYVCVTHAFSHVTDYWVAGGSAEALSVNHLCWSYAQNGKAWTIIDEPGEGNWVLTSVFYDNDEDVFWFSAAPTTTPFTTAALFKMTPGTNPPVDRTWERFDLPAGATSGGWSVAGVNDVFGPVQVVFFAYPVTAPTPPPPPVPDPAGQAEMWFSSTGPPPVPPAPPGTGQLIGAIGF